MELTDQDSMFPSPFYGNPIPEDPMAKQKKGTHGGPRIAGSGKKMGRPERPEPKSKPIWCGQHTDAQRDLIVQTLTPEERLAALLAAAEAKKARSS